MGALLRRLQKNLNVATKARRGRSPASAKAHERGETLSRSAKALLPGLKSPGLAQFKLFVDPNTGKYLPSANSQLGNVETPGHDLKSCPDTRPWVVKIEADFQVSSSGTRYKVLAGFCDNTVSRAGLCFEIGFMQGLKPKSV
jgi:hypothetical protein